MSEKFSVKWMKIQLNEWKYFCHKLNTADKMRYQKYPTFALNLISFGFVHGFAVLFSF